MKINFKNAVLFLLVGISFLFFGNFTAKAQVFLSDDILYFQQTCVCSNDGRKTLFIGKPNQNGERVLSLSGNKMTETTGGVVSNFLNSVKNSTGCFSPTAHTAVLCSDGVSTGCFDDWTCETSQTFFQSTFQRYCFCKKQSMDTEKVSYSCQKGYLLINNNDLQNYDKTFKISQDNQCPGVLEEKPVSVNYCCCRRVVSDNLTSTNDCVLHSSTALKPTCDEDNAKLTTSTSGGSISLYEPFSPAQDGTCSGLITQKITDGRTPKTEFALDVQALKAEAADLNPFNWKTPAQFLGVVINILTSLMGVILLVFYIWAGFLWMTAAGSSEKIDSAKKIFVWATLGVVVVLASYMISNFVFTSLK